MTKPKASTEKKKALKAFSDYIRERDRWTCYTCGKRGDAHTMDAGHLISRYWAGTLFDEDNVHCQCKGCNILHEQDPEPFKRMFLVDHSESEYWVLYAKSKQVVKRTAQDYIDLRQLYEAKLRHIREGE